MEFVQVDRWQLKSVCQLLGQIGFPGTGCTNDGNALHKGNYHTGYVFQSIKPVSHLC